MSDKFGDSVLEDDELEITPKRIDELILWHGTDESALPPAHTLQHLSRDTVAALHRLARDRQTIAQLRAAMSRAFWATDRRDLNAILLEALGPPPEESHALDALETTDAPSERGTPICLDADVGHALHHPGAQRPLSPRVS